MYVYVYLQPLADAYGLLMHRNGQWEWTLAPGVSPSSRYQHAAVSANGTFHKFLWNYFFFLFFVVVLFLEKKNILLDFRRGKFLVTGHMILALD